MTAVEHRRPPLNCCPLRWHAIRQPEEIALYTDRKAFTYSEFDQKVSACCRLLHRYPVHARIVVVGRNSYQQVLLQVAALRSGRRFVALNHRLAIPQLQALLREETDTLFWLEPDMPDGLAKGTGQRLDLDALDKALGEELEVAPVARDDWPLDAEIPCALLQTSGSSGQAKWVAHAYRAHFYSAEGSQAVIPLAAGDRWLLSLPLFHIGGQAIVWRSLLAGSALVLSERSLTDALRSTGVTHLSLVNTQLHRLLSEQGHAWFGALKVLLLGGAAVSPHLLVELRQAPFRVLTSYGMTELASQICTGEAQIRSGKLCSGELLPGRELKIDASGQIWLRGLTLMLGYWQQGRLVRATDSAGWFASGDLGRWYGDQLWVSGRVDRRMISGGENIQPEEIERVLLQHPNVAEVMVVALPNLEYGERPVAFLRMHDGPANAIKWPVWLSDKLARFKIPEFFWDWPDEASTGLKVNRRQFERLALRNRDAAEAVSTDRND